MTDSEIFSNAIVAATPMINTIVDVFVRPKLEKIKNSNEPLPTGKEFTEYLSRTYKRLAVMNTLVFRNSQLLLEDVYVPLSIIKKPNPRDEGEVERTFVIDNFPLNLSDEFHNILITDTAGMGKSTMMKKIFISAISQNSGIPLFIELRRLNKNKKLLDEIQEQLSPIGRKFSETHLLRLLAEGDFIIILDGYDEITLSERDIVTRDIQDFMAQTANNKFFITSRPEDALSCFGGFQEFTIKPLAKSQAFELLRKYDHGGTTSSLLVKKLQGDDQGGIEEFLTNPLLVSLLFIAFEHKQTIPLKKYLFYRQVFDAYFEAHDLTKGNSYVHDKYSGLSIDDFHRVLRHIGFVCFEQQKVEFSKDELLEMIKRSNEYCVGLSFKESDLLKDLLNTVPLFTRDGNYYRWSHKSLSEYFAAQFIYMDAKELQAKILLAIYNNSQLGKFINVLDLYYDMDYKTFRNIIEYNLLDEYCNYLSTSYQHKYEGVSEDAIRERQQLMFFFDKVLVARKNHSASVFANSGCSNGFGAGGWNVEILCRYASRRNIIAILLFEKKNTITQTISSEYSKIKINCEELRKHKTVQITDDLNSELNSPVNFQLVNNLLKNIINWHIPIEESGGSARTFDNRFGIVINHAVALNTRDEIKTSIEAEKGGSMFSGFLR